MRKNPFNQKDEPLTPVKVTNYLKEIDIRSIGPRNKAPTFQYPSDKKAGDRGVSLTNTPEPNFQSDTKDPKKRTRNRSNEDNRSNSELGRLDSIEIQNSSARRTNTLEKASGVQPYHSNNNYSESKNNSFKVKLPKLGSQENQLVQTPNKSNGVAADEYQGEVALKNTISMTLEVPKKRRLQPLKHDKVLSFYKTKAGSTGKQIKTNQDSIIAQHKLPFGLKLFCVCDGHGVNGHIVSGFIKTQLVKNLTKLLRRTAEEPESIIPTLQLAFQNTNQELLDSEINTDLSGSTVIAVFLYKGKLISLNVGDSRAILCQYNMEKGWKVKELSSDQKPSREDQKQRILKAGGRIQAQKDQHGNDLGPLRVWMANIQMPGLAMTRSFGDKAGVRAGTNGVPQILEHEITHEDKFIVVASDGVWEYIENDEVMNLLTPFYVKNTLELGCERVVSYATAVWRKVCLSRDDISIIVVSLNDP